jgi:hypothetical protein
MVESQPWERHYYTRALKRLVSVKHQWQEVQMTSAVLEKWECTLLGLNLLLETLPTSRPSVEFLLWTNQLVEHLLLETLPTTGQLMKCLLMECFPLESLLKGLLTEIRLLGILLMSSLLMKSLLLASRWK